MVKSNFDNVHGSNSEIYLNFSQLKVLCRHFSKIVGVCGSEKFYELPSTNTGPFANMCMTMLSVISWTSELMEWTICRSHFGKIRVMCNPGTHLEVRKSNMTRSLGRLILGRKMCHLSPFGEPYKLQTLRITTIKCNCVKCLVGLFLKHPWLLSMDCMCRTNNLLLSSYNAIHLVISRQSSTVL